MPPRNPADRPATEPRTEAGRTMRTLLMDMYTAWAFIIDANGIEVDEMPDDPLPLILAIEAEAAQGAAPLTAAELRIAYNTGRSHGYDDGYRATQGAAPRAEGHTVRYVDAGRDEPPENGCWRCSCGKSFAPDGVDEYASHLDAPRAEGLDRERERIAIELNHYDLSDDPGYIKVPTERVRAILTARPSDERVPESEERA